MEVHKLIITFDSTKQETQMGENNLISGFIGFAIGSLGVCLFLLFSYGDGNEKEAVKDIKTILRLNEEPIDSACITKLPKNVRIVFNGTTYHAQCYVPAYNGANYKEWEYIWEYQGLTSKRWSDHYMPLNPVSDSCAAKTMALQYLAYQQRAKRAKKVEYLPIN